MNGNSHHFMPNNTVSFDINDEEFLNNELALKSLMNKKIRDELMQIRELNNAQAYSKSVDECDATASVGIGTSGLINTETLSSHNRFSSSFLAEFNNQQPTQELCIESFDFMKKSADKFKTWPATTANPTAANNPNTNNNVQTLLNSINETQNTATHLQPQKSTDKTRNAGTAIDAMCGMSSHDSDKSHNVASSIQSADEFISPVDKQIAAIFRMTLSNSDNLTLNNVSLSNGAGGGDTTNGKKSKRHTVYSTNTAGECFDDDFQTNEEEEDKEDRNDTDRHNCDDVRSELDLHTFKRAYKANILEKQSADDTCSTGDIKSRTRDSIRRVFTKFGKAVKHVQNKAEEALNSEVSESDSDDVILNNETMTKAIKVIFIYSPPFSFKSII